MLSAVREAVQLLRRSPHVVALTGAGISTPSGIPDFRSARSGLWTYTDPLEIASIWAFHDRPAEFYRWMRPLAQRIESAIPNKAHHALAELEHRGRLQAVITQNIDSLHQRAGSRRVLELHGHGRSATCLHCMHRTSADKLWPAVLRGELPPPCSQCGGVLKPDVILFGEPLPYEALSQAQSEALACDAMLIVGTSLEVMPAADLPMLARRRGAHLILVNRDYTPLDHVMDVVIRLDVAKGVPQLVEAVLA